MNEKHIQDTKAKLTEISDFLKTLDPELKPKALLLLLPFYFEDIKTPAPKEDVGETPPSSDNTNIENGQEFFSSYMHDKPAENVVMIAAWLYSKFGTYPITPSEIKDYASRLGITIASRADNTMRQAKREGKSLFRQSGKGWEPTLIGESYFKDTYKVKKGTIPHPKEM